MKSTNTVMTCDRCGREQTIPMADPKGCAAVWARLAAEQASGALRIGKTAPMELKDICESCMKALLNWWEMKFDDGHGS